jgi:predicted nucleotidyltransferase
VSVVAPADPTELLRDLDRAMSTRRMRWYVFGAQAVMAYGRPRLTADVDAAIDAPDVTAAEFAGWLADYGFELRFPIDSRPDAKLIPLVHRATAMPLDLLIASSELQEEFLARARRIDLGGVEVPVVTAEDLVAMKILAGRRKDLEDVRSVLLEQGAALDRDRVLGVLKRLEAETGDARLLRRWKRAERDSR